MDQSDIFANHRLLLYYKGDISALILFAQHGNGSVCFPEPLPALSSALEPEELTIVSNDARQVTSGPLCVPAISESRHSDY
jgi:hypothetical protein